MLLMIELLNGFRAMKTLLELQRIATHSGKRTPMTPIEPRKERRRREREQRRFMKRTADGSNIQSSKRGKVLMGFLGN